jgi:dipeptidyl aminopeptidase/acylaminoacyl peptidase
VHSAVLAPDGGRVVYCRRTALGDTRYRTSLWTVPYGGGRPRRLTHGAWNDWAPAFAPDGSWIAFLSDRGEGERARLMRMPLDGGEAELVCDPEHGAGPPLVSPDGRLIAYVAAGGQPRLWAGDPKRRLARVIRAADWRDDDAGVRDYRSHVHLVRAVAGARPRQLTQGDFDVGAACWHPDGDRLGFVSDLEPDADLRRPRRVYEIGLDGGRPRELVALQGSVGLPSWSPDGRWLALVGTDVPDSPDHAEPQLFVAGDGATRSLTATLDLPVVASFATDLIDWLHSSEPPPAWDGERIVVTIGRRGRDEIWEASPAGQPRPLVQDELTVGSVSVAAGRIAVTGTVGIDAAEVYAVEDGGLRRLTRHGGAWLRRHRLPAGREVDAGGVPAFLVEPAGADGAGALVLRPHGGPYGNHGPTPRLDDLLLAELGYRVLRPNIRGSAGYGSDWVRQNFGRWGGPDAEDLMGSVDWAVEAGLADPARLALLGLSYGGWAVNWLAATSDRFRCAISENGVADMVSAHAVSCIGPTYDRSIGYGPVADHHGKLWEASPLRHVAGIRIPMLLLQGEADRICPLDDTYQLFVALRELGRPVELVLYPEEHHGMLATARPDRRIDRFRRIAEFLCRHCPPA